MSLINYQELSTYCNCNMCTLNTSEKVYGRYGSIDNPKADVMYIGIAPGDRENVVLKVFWGPSGALLREALIEIGQSIENAYLTNVLLCKPHKYEKANSLDVPVDCCSLRLLEEIKRVRPKHIVCLGDVAAKAVLHTRKNLGELREKVHSGPYGIPTHVTFHPAYILREPDSASLFYDDLADVYYPPPPAPKAKYKVVKWLDVPFPRERIAFDIETSSEVYLLGEVLCAGFYFPSKKLTYIVEGEFEVGRILHEWKKKCIAIKGLPPPQLDVHNLIFEYSWMIGKYGIDIRSWIKHDTMLDYFQTGEHKRVGLKELGMKLLNLHNWEREFKATLPKKWKTYGDGPRSALYQYLAYDCMATSMLADLVEAKN